MEIPVTSTTIVTKGTLIGHVLGEWDGFTFGKLIIERLDGVRIEFRFGKESQGTIPRIGSLVTVEHTSGILPEISKLVLIEDSDDSRHRSCYAPSLILGRSVGVGLFVLADFTLGFVLILMGFMAHERYPLTSVIYVLCGVPHIAISYLLWYFTGD